MASLKRQREGAEMTASDEPLTQNYDSDKQKNEIDSNSHWRFKI